MRVLVRISWSKSDFCILAAGNVSVEACQAGGEGGGIYTASVLSFTANESEECSTHLKDNAALSGGALMASGQSAVVHVASGHALLIVNNSAQLDGGGVGMVKGSVFLLLDEGCANTCEPHWRGNNICDPPCLTRGCNW
jgi:hypothetical protein